jgi:hypothetical protein
MNNSLTQLFKTLSSDSVEVLIRYPALREQVIQALEQQPLPFSYQPDLIEIFDQQGLLAGQVNGYVYTVTLSPLHVSRFLAWYLDGELAFLSVGSQVIVNRLTLLSIGASFDLPKKETYQ